MRRKRVILYDSDVYVLELLKSYFERNGYEVFAFTEPVTCPIYKEEAHKCQKNEACADIVIAEFSISNTTGLQLFNNQKERGCKLCIENMAIISGHSPKGLMEKIKELGCAFFRKPLYFSSSLKDWLNECEKRIDLSQPIAEIKL